MPNGLNCSRRSMLHQLGAAALVSPFAIRQAASATIPQRPSSRVIIDNDLAGDPDGLVALAHQLLNKRTRATLITTSALDPKLSVGLSPGKTATAGATAALELIAVAAIAKAPAVRVGSELFGTTSSPAAQAIVDEAMREDRLPLFLTCGGPLTNVAAALRLEPRIATRMTLIWIGGGAYPEGSAEYNAATDVASARYVIERSLVPIWQVPQPTYRQVQYSVAEMGADFRPISPLTAWLYERYTALPAWVDLGASLTFGDSPLVLLSGLSVESCRFRDLSARTLRPDGSYGAEVPNRRIRVFDELDHRLLLADMLATFRSAAYGSSRNTSGKPLQ